MNSIYDQFRLEGGVIHCGRYGNGHINETYLVATDKPHLYILQKVNQFVFKDTKGLMNNIISVTKYLRKADNDPRHVLTLVPTCANDPYLATAEGACWRMYEFVTDSLCLNAPRNQRDFQQSGIAFGQFQRQLANFPADTLTETIPRFHDTPDRFSQLKQAIQENRVGRLREVQAELDFCLAREQDGAALMNLLHSGDLPLRVTHNDTKLNNVMLDRSTGTPLCVIDLDTVMPGLAAYDFGDSIRFGAATAAEDERALGKVSMSLDLFQVYAEGFLSACGDCLTPVEIETLPIGAKLMTLECGIRFLADYLNGDVYFHAQREGQNLDRARSQFALVADMEKQRDSMMSIIGRISK